MCSILSDTEMGMMTHSWQCHRQMDNSNRVPPPQVQQQVQQQNLAASAWRALRTQSSCRVVMLRCVQHVQPYSKPKGLTENPKAYTCAQFVVHG